MSSQKSEIPKHVFQNLARAFADDIIAFFESEEGQKEYEVWLQQKKENENKEIAQEKRQGAMNSLPCL